MTRYEIGLLYENDIEETARFLGTWHRSRQSADQFVMPENADRGHWERHLRWLLVENPGQVPKAALGACLRSSEGVIAGLILFFSSSFVWGNEKLSGLCSGSFFVDQTARMQGYFLFRRYLNEADCDFLFATTCNPSSGALWKRFGGWPVPASEFEDVLPIRFGPIARAFALSKGWRSLAVRFSEGMGVSATPLLKAQRLWSPNVTIQPCRDWDYLAGLAEKYRNPNQLTSARSSKYLQWRYERNPATHSNEVYSFHEPQGSEGWFAVDTTIRGRTGQVRTLRLLDVVCAETIPAIKSVISAVVRLGTGRSDMILLTGRLMPQLKKTGYVSFRRKLDEPQCYVIASNGRGKLLAEHAAFVLADGDSAY